MGCGAKESTCSKEDKCEILKRSVEAYNRAAGHAERWAAAQAICGISAPQVQKDLEGIRREVMEIVARARDTQAAREGRVSLKEFRAMIAPKAMQHESWETYQITPEVASDMSLTGIKLPTELVRRLKHILRKQQLIVKAAVRSTVGKK